MIHVDPYEVFINIHTFTHAYTLPAHAKVAPRAVTPSKVTTHLVTPPKVMLRRAVPPKNNFCHEPMARPELFFQFFFLTIFPLRRVSPNALTIDRRRAIMATSRHAARRAHS